MTAFTRTPLQWRTATSTIILLLRYMHSRSSLANPTHACHRFCVASQRSEGQNYRIRVVTMSRRGGSLIEVFKLVQMLALLVSSLHLLPRASPEDRGR